MTVRLYSWDDVGAPQKSIVNDGSLLNILRGCLIDGYGTRTSAGWTMPFSDLPNNKAVFKPNITLEVYLQLDDSLDYRYAYVRGYKTMSGIDVGTGRFPDPVTNMPDATYKAAISKRYNTNADTNRWWVIADDTFFYYLTPHSSYSGGFFFGKITSQGVNEQIVLTSHYTASTLINTNQYRSLFNDSGGNFMVYPDRFNSGNHEAVIKIRDANTYANPNPVSGKLLLVKERIVNNVNPYSYIGDHPNWFRCAGPKITALFNGEKLVLDTIKYLVVDTNEGSWLFEYEEETG